MLIQAPSVQAPAAWDKQNLTVAGMRTRLTDAGYRYLIHPAETAAGLVAANLNLGFDPGDLRRYKCDITGGTDNTAQINNAIAAATAAGGWGYVIHPGGIIAFASQILFPNNITVFGFGRALCEFRFTGNPAGAPANTRSAFRYNSGLVNSSGYANVFFRDFTLNYQNAINFAAGIEINAGGWSYFGVTNVWVKGGCSYGVILDAVEICTVERCLIENTNATSNFNIWITNGADRSAGQTTGFSNVITIRENQISAGAGSIGLVDDGGNAHTVQSNNFNQHRFPATFSGCTALKLGGNSFETTLQTGSANVLFQAVTQAGNPVGPCCGFEIGANGFFGNMSAAGKQLTFGGTLNTITGVTQAASGVVTVNTAAAANPFVVGSLIYFSGIGGMTQLNGLAATVTAIGGVSGAWTATFNINTTGFGAYTAGGQAQMMHSGGFVKGNVFGDQLGRGSAIDVTFLANSECSCNTDLAKTGGASHYAGVHNDTNGNLLLPPANGFTGGLGLGTNNPIWGDTRFRQLFLGGLIIQGGALSPSDPTTAGQAGAVYQGIGAPNNANGNNGDVYFRTDTPATANQRLYIKSAGAWVGIV